MQFCHWNRGPEMTEVEPVLDFASSGRSGRRNALPDILGSPAGVNPGDLPLKLAEMSLTGKKTTMFSSSWSGRGPVTRGGGASSAAGELGGERGIVKGARWIYSPETCNDNLRATKLEGDLRERESDYLRSVSLFGKQLNHGGRAATPLP
ncbi:cAMP-dependent protein kinase inhibitor beta [Liparis tanakae]|uniref:cAMP-dependent protein kinase inhibitor beta n=1 Tax=Liparis tanakae TaxID=230148 RepID=A0A4Z2J8Y3_9TELE|nr:cAMP-dependent protein kinase inhibitor beta [Liparis tanakae]